MITCKRENDKEGWKFVSKSKPSSAALAVKGYTRAQKEFKDCLKARPTFATRVTGDVAKSKETGGYSGLEKILR